MPSAQPSSVPRAQPIIIPSAEPSRSPSIRPSGYPTTGPSGQPMAYPTSRPSRRPSRKPSRQPVRIPSTQPSSTPSAQPIIIPSASPSRIPIAIPSTVPTNAPIISPPPSMPIAVWSNYNDTLGHVAQDALTTRMNVFENIIVTSNNNEMLAFNLDGTVASTAMLPCNVSHYAATSSHTLVYVCSESSGESTIGSYDVHAMETHWLQSLALTINGVAFNTDTLCMIGSDENHNFVVLTGDPLTGVMRAYTYALAGSTIFPSSIASVPINADYAGFFMSGQVNNQPFAASFTTENTPISAATLNTQANNALKTLAVVLASPSIDSRCYECGNTWVFGTQIISNSLHATTQVFYGKTNAEIVGTAGGLTCQEPSQFTDAMAIKLSFYFLVLAVGVDENNHAIIAAFVNHKVTSTLRISSHDTVSSCTVGGDISDGVFMRCMLNNNQNTSENLIVRLNYFSNYTISASFIDTTRYQVTRDDLLFGSGGSFMSHQTLTQTPYFIHLPTSQPTSTPFALPSSLPSSSPTAIPTQTPTVSQHPTTFFRPSRLPTHTPAPSWLPSSHPSAQPNAAPSSLPTEQPNNKPTTTPSTQPNGQPSSQPSSQPQATPSAHPIAHPSSRPSHLRSSKPTTKPTKSPNNKSAPNDDAFADDAISTAMGLLFSVCIVCLLVACLAACQEEPRAKQRVAPSPKPNDEDEAVIPEALQDDEESLYSSDISSGSEGFKHFNLSDSESSISSDDDTPQLSSAESKQSLSSSDEGSNSTVSSSNSIFKDAFKSDSSESARDDENSRDREDAYCNSHGKIRILPGSKLS